MKKSKPPKNELAELLGTGNQKEQVEQVRRLLEAPIVELVIRLDVRTNRLSFAIVGGQLPPVLAYQMLDGCRELIRQQELQAVAESTRNGKPHEEGETT